MPIIEMITELVLEESSMGRASALDDDLGVGAESLISILGKRGSGKTTLLASVCASLEGRGQALVLPTLRPEIFESTDSLLLAMLIDVEGLSAMRRREKSPQGSDFGMTLSEATRSVSVSSSGALAALSQSRESAGQFGVDATALVRHRKNQRGAIAAMFRSLRAHVGEPPGIPIVVPIDDADLSPANLQSILTAVRVLGSIPGILPMMCADRAQLELAVLSDIHKQYGTGVPEERARQLSIQIMAKLLRPERSFAPPWLSQLGRADFAPIGRRESLRDVLARPVAAGEVKLSGLLWRNSAATEGLQPDGINAWLPETPRELEYLWESVVAVGRADRELGPAARAQRYQRLVQHILAYSREYSVSVEPSESVDNANENLGGLRIVWPRMSYGVASMGRWVPAVSLPEVRLNVRRVARYRVAVFPENSSVASREADLSQAATSSVQALQELQISGALGGNRQSSPSFIGDNEFEFMQNVTISGQSTDDKFLMMPDSCGVTAMNRAAIAWNSLVDDARNSNRSHSEIGATYLIRRFLYVICAYWLQGDERALRAKRIPSLERLLDRATSTYLDRVQNDDLLHLDQYSASRAYCHWFETKFPAVMHASLLGSSKSRAAVAMWLNAISAGPRAVEATAALRTALEDRFATRFEEERRKKNGESSWIYGYESLVRNVGTGLYADVLLLRDAFEERQRSRSVGHDILGDSVSLSMSTGSYKYAAHRTVEGDEQMAVLREVLEQYRSR